MMNIVICTSNISAYMASCWQELSHREDISLFVLAFEPNVTSNAPFDTDLMNSLEYVLLNSDARNDSKLIHRIVTGQSPDFLILPGWFHNPYRKLVFASDFKSVKCILTMDTNLKNNLWQLMGKYRFRSYFKEFNCIFVPGERSWQMARFLGFPKEKIYRGLYCLDYKRFAPMLQKRLTSTEGWPKCFLYVGQYIKRKGLDILLKAYSKYKERVSKPWALNCCGKGPMSYYMQNNNGVSDLGFMQVNDLPSIMLQAGAFILPSRFDAWGVSLVEACASGLPVICTEGCGASVEVVRSFYNGISIPAGNIEALTNSLLWMHNHYSILPVMGKRSQELSKPFSSECWADRIIGICKGDIKK